MSERNGHATAGMNGDLLRNRRETAERVARELGPEYTQEQHDAAMREAGELPYSEPGWYAVRKRVFSTDRPKRTRPAETTRTAPAAPAVIQDRPEPPNPPSPVDYLGKLLRFGLAVEQVGGTANARRMLDALEQIQRAEGGR